MNILRAKSALIPTLLLPALALAQTQPAQSPEDIRRIAADFIAKQLPAVEGQVLHAVADDLDPRLRLAPCAGAPTGLLPAAARMGERVTVGVTCAQPKWTVYVPVRIETEMPVLIARRAVARNAAVTETDVEIRTQRVPGLSSSYVGSLQQLTGRHLRQPLSPGMPVTVDLLAADILVKRGQRVTLVATGGGLEVRAQGEAVADATPAGRVRVLNLNSRRIVEGEVESSDLVRVRL